MQRMLIDTIPKRRDRAQEEAVVSTVRPSQRGEVTFSSAETAQPDLVATVITGEPAPTDAELREAQKGCDACKQILDALSRRPDLSKIFEIVEGILVKKEKTRMGMVHRKVAPQQFHDTLLWNAHYKNRRVGAAQQCRTSDPRRLHDRAPDPTHHQSARQPVGRAPGADCPRKHSTWGRITHLGRRM